MIIAEATLTVVAEAVISYALDRSGVVDWMREKTGRDPVRQAFARALGKAFAYLNERYPQQVTDLLDLSFFEREGAQVLAQFLVRDGAPSPSDLAARWADSLNLRDPERRTTHTREIEPLAADFLDQLAHALKAEQALGPLHDSRAFERITADVAALRRAFDADQATPGTRRDYLHWLIDRHLYLDPRGTFQTRRQVQVKLDEVYVSLRAQRDEAPGGADRKQLEEELQALEAQLTASGLAAAEIEDRGETLLARLAQREAIVSTGPVAADLAEVVAGNPSLVILGDPGGGKSTLLRYLALKHAQALWDGRADAGDNLGAARFPVLIRIADYVESGVWRTQPLSDFLAATCSRQECPRTGLADLLARALEAGNCLVLLDGLDEIVSADDRRGVVQQIEHFVRRHDDRDNRFVVTSRVAGYRSASLGAPFATTSSRTWTRGRSSAFLSAGAQRSRPRRRPTFRWRPAARRPSKRSTPSSRRCGPTPACAGWRPTRLCCARWR